MKSAEKNAKTMSYILRHRPDDFGIEMDAHGWVKVDDLVQAIQDRRDADFNEEVLDWIVANDEKTRFSYSDDRLLIRANQGHSIPVDLSLEPTCPPSILYHGTARRFLADIYEEGITRQSRQYVHLSSNYETAMNVGARHGEPYVILIDALRMYDDGIDFFLSANGVWLVDYVDPKYFFDRNDE